ncbi:MAG: DoxX family membrane protein [Desulfohalobiaceae bacterium]|nr:DoxX family membrane protein [Desulfohalobiaceae bacterium]
MTLSSELDTNSRKQPEGRASSTMRVVYHALRLLLGGIFLYASYDKILHPAAFAEAVYNYQILPDYLVNLVALVLPWLELLLGLCLIAGVWLPGTIVISTGLLTVFIAALVFNQLRGLDIHCGCFSTETSEGPAGILTVFRDVFFLAVSTYLTFAIFLFLPRLQRAEAGEQEGHCKTGA